MARLSELLPESEIIGTNLDSDPEISGLCSDSFSVKPGGAFICLAGGSHDGHDFICVAVDRGASLIIAERLTPWLEKHPDTRFLLVRNTRRAESVMWNNICGRPSERMQYVAVTGTNGKTSTTCFMRGIFREAGFVTGLIGTVKCLSGDRTDIIGESDVNSMTTPPPDKLYPELKRMADDGVEIVFLEASSHALSQHRLDPLRFRLSVFTNLTPEHLDYHGDMEHYFEAKLRLLALSDCAAVNVDDNWMARITRCPIPVTTYSVGGEADFTAKDARCLTDRHGVSYRLSEPGGEYEITCPIDGMFTVHNTLAAASAARLFGISPEVIQKALADSPQIPGRMEMIDSGLGFDICVDYAHTPDALRLVLETLRAKLRRGGRLIAVFGCGGDRDRSKRPEMGRIASELADFAVITSDNSRSENPRAIIFDIIRGVGDRSKCRVVEKREKAIAYAISEARAGDIILLAGKGHEDYEIDSTGKHPFSERSVIEKALNAGKT